VGLRYMMQLLRTNIRRMKSVFGLFESECASEEEKRTSYLYRWIFKGVCPVCCKDLKTRHEIANVGSCNFSGPNLNNGFLIQVKNRKWQEVIEPFTRITSMELMACEILCCPNSIAIVVWVEVDLAIGGDQYLVYSERIEEYDFEQIQQAKTLNWISFGRTGSIKWDVKNKTSPDPPGEDIL